MKTIAFLGLGTMGLPMAANLLRAGYVVRAWNCSPAPLGKLAALGAQAAASPAEAPRAPMRLVSMLADDAATRYAVLEAGALAALAPARCTSTWPPCRWRWRPSWRGCMASAAWPMWRRRCWAGSTWPRPASSISWRRRGAGAAGGAAAVRRDGPQDLVFRRTSRAGQRRQAGGELHDRQRHRSHERSGCPGARLRRGQGGLPGDGHVHRIRRAGVPGLWAGHRRRALRAGRLQAGAGPGRTCAWRRKRPSRCTCRCNWPACCAMRTSRAWRAARASWTGPPCRARRRGGPGWSKASGRAAPDQAGAARACRRHRGKPQVIFLSPAALRPAGVAYWLSGRHTAMLSRRRDRRNSVLVHCRHAVATVIV